MKKVLAVVLSLMMILTCMLPAFAAEKTIANPATAYAPYDKAAVASGTVDLSYDQIAGVLLDWLDRKIAETAADFNAFVDSLNVAELAQYKIEGVDSLIGLKDHVADLGGDFANLNTEALVTREGGDVNFLFGIFQFMADNAETFGKVFRWDDEVFDYGKVGEYIETLEDGNAIKTFYHDYLLTGDIQDKFVREIAREMNYEVPETRTETFDEIISNGVKANFLEIFGELLSAESVAAVNAMDLRTTDVYALVKEFVGLLQNDYKGQFDELLAGFLSALQGMVKIITAAVNVEPPTVTVGDANGVIGTYHPGSADLESYMPKIYSPYKEQLSGTEYYDMIEGETLPEAYAALVAGDGVEMAEKFVLDAQPVPDELTAAGYTFPIEISFSDIESYMNGQIAAMLPDLQEQVDAVVAQAITSGQAMIDSLPISLGITLEGGVTINSATVSLSYKGYSDDDTFVMEVTAIPAVDVSFTGNVWQYAGYAGITEEKIREEYIQKAIDEVVTNPAATVVVDNLSGEIEELAQLQSLVNLIDADATYDYTLLDVMTDYDTYKGAIGQLNHILYKAVDMIASDEGMADLALEDGGNELLYANLQKICNKVSGLLDLMKQYIPEEQFTALAETADISSAFASEHGFNAGMIYNMDFSSVENALVCGIRMGCDLLVEDDPNSVLYDFHLRVEDLETLDAMAAAAVDMLLGKVMDKINLEGFDYAYTPIDYANVAEDGAKDAIMDKVVDILYYCATYATDKINSVANKALDKVNEQLGLGLGDVAFDLGVEKSADWETTLNALVDRFIELTDGLCIASGEAKGNADVWAKINILVNALLPMNSMFSNYTGIPAVNAAFFDKALDGDMGDFLKLFEVKEDAIAGGVPVTKALINASDYIVDAFFPDTVEAQLYTAGETVQETFTASESDQGIAARNMISINNRRAHILPALLDLVKESGLLPAFVCDHSAAPEEIPAVAATCTTTGKTAGTRCPDCGMILSGCEETPINPDNHTGLTEIPAVAATCTAAGSTAGTKCTACGKTVTAPTATDKLAHNYADGVCTVCGAKDPAYHAPDEGGDSGDNGGSASGFAAFWQRIVSFFQRIVNFFRNLFRR